VIVISAMSRDGIIGRGAGMPWNIPAEFDQFLGFVRDQTVIMGRRAESIDGAVVARSMGAALETAQGLGGTVFSAGGAEVYRQTIPLASEMYLSYIKGSYSGDTRFPEFDESEWQITRREDHPEFEFVVYRRRDPGSGATRVG
jgi:dihydrofolate reductase